MSYRGRKGGDNKTEESNIIMQDKEGMMRKELGKTREVKEERGCSVW